MFKISQKINKCELNNTLSITIMNESILHLFLWLKYYQK